MANRYWVGGTGTWNTTSTTNWSASPGGGSGASVPTAADSVFFDRTGSYTVTMTGALACLDITVSAGTVTFATGTTPTLAISGSMSLLAGTIWSSTAALTFNATTTGKTITTNGVTMSGAITLNSNGGGWTLGSALTMQTASYANGIFTVTRGTFNTGNYNMTLTIFDSNSLGLRSITLGTSTITLARWTFTTITNLTFSAASSTINYSAIGNTNDSFQGGGLTYGTVTFNNNIAGELIIHGTNTFNIFTVNAKNATGFSYMGFAANQTITTLTLNAPAAVNRRVMLISNTYGTQRTLTVTNITATPTDYDFRDIVISGATLSGTRIGNGTNCSGITFSTPKTVYWNKVAGGNWSDTDAWAASSGAATSSANFPLLQDTAIIENTGLNTSATITLDSNQYISTIDASTRTTAMSLAQPGGYSLYGSFIMGSGVTLSGIADGVSFFGSNNQTITMNGVTFTRPLIINKPVAGSVTLGGTFTSTNTTTLTAGTLDLSGNTLTTTSFASSGTVARSVTSSTAVTIFITLASGGAVWNTGTATNLTFSNNVTVDITVSSGGTKTINSGQGNEADTINFVIGGNGPTYTFTASNRVRNLTITNTTCIISNIAISIYGNLDIQGTSPSLGGGTNTWTFAATSSKTITTSGLALNLPITFNGVGGTWTLQDALTGGLTRLMTLTAGTLALGIYTLTVGKFASSNSNTRTINFGTGSINLNTASNETVWDTATTTGLTISGTPTVNTTGGGASAKTINSGAPTEANTISFNLLNTAGTVAFTSGNRVKNLTINGSFTLSNVAISIYGNYTYTTATALTAGANAWTFAAGSGSVTINSGGVTHDFPMTFNGKLLGFEIYSTFILSSNLTIGGSRTLTLTNGTIDLNGKTLNAGNSFTTAAGNKNLTFNGGTLRCGFGTTLAFNNAAPTGFTTTAGTGTGIIALSGAAAQTFIGGGSTYNCTLEHTGSGQLTITGSNTFNDITDTYSPSTILFTAGTTNTFNNFSLSGTPGNLSTIGSTVAGSQFTLSKASGTVNVSYCAIKDSIATGGARWQAYTSKGSIDSGSNSGWNFTDGSMLSMFFIPSYILPDDYVTYNQKVDISAASITIPATAAVGDLAILIDSPIGATTPTLVIPSGWNSVYDFSGTATSAMRISFSYKILTSGDPGSSVTGMTGSLASRKSILIFKRTAGFTTITGGGGVGEMTDGDPTQKTIATGAQLAPVIAIAIGYQGAAATLSSATMTILNDDLTTARELAYAIMNTTTQDHLFDVTDIGTNNGMAGCYFKIA